MVWGSFFFGRCDLVFFLFYIYLFYLLVGFNLFILLPLIKASRGCCDERISGTGLKDSGKKKTNKSCLIVRRDEHDLENEKTLGTRLALILLPSR